MCRLLLEHAVDASTEVGGPSCLWDFATKKSSRVAPSSFRAELLIMSDLLYTGLEQADALERTLRALIRAGDCRYLLLCWQERFCSNQAEAFLSRLEDLTTSGTGEAQTVWRGWAPRAGNEKWEAGESQLRGAISLLVM